MAAPAVAMHCAWSNKEAYKKTNVSVSIVIQRMAQSSVASYGDVYGKFAEDASNLRKKRRVNEVRHC